MAPIGILRRETEPRIWMIAVISTSAYVIGSNAQLNLPLFGIEKWAQTFGQTIYEVCAKATAISDIRTDYLLMDPKVKQLDGFQLVKELKSKMEEMLQKKIRAVQRLVEVAEHSYSQHVFDKELNISYPMAKKLNGSEFQLEANARFNDLEVNVTRSTVHVPTNVFDQSADVLNGVSWSESLDEFFTRNMAVDQTSTWQYFCSAKGFLRYFPGTAWQTETYNGAEKNIDVFDCRVSRWYMQAAAYPKDVVVLLDASGSMKGLRIEIAKATVEKILDTLGDDDFFNVIKYSDSVEFVEDCFNATIVQASEKNKQLVKKSLSKLKTQNIAHLDVALVAAFELLLASNDSGRGSLCNKAIMVVTDGATETYEKIFEKYNPPPNTNIRVFTYLIGREVGDARNVLWMACRNKGRFSHITSLADVHEHVQRYIHVLSRPVVISRSRDPLWTNVYLDTHDPGLELMTSIAQPVFDIKNETVNNGILLGVVGSDVPLKELVKITPPYKLGVSGYAFAITNNGHVLFHPRFKPMSDDQYRKESYAVDISEIELLHNDSLLRNRMIERETGFAQGVTVVATDQMRRARPQKTLYFFTGLKDTPFSLAISVPEIYGLSLIDSSRSSPVSDLSALRIGDLTLAPWRFCDWDSSDRRQHHHHHPLEAIIKALGGGGGGGGGTGNGNGRGELYNERCDMELIDHLLFDAEATRGALASWMKENHDGILNDDDSKRNGVEMVFLGTKGGLTRFLRLTDNLTDPEFIESHNSTIEESYYIRAVENGEMVFTFSVPFNPGKENLSETVLTVSSPIVISEEGVEAVAAVVGLQILYSKFFDVFMNITRTCSFKDTNCNLTCDSEEINCYLLDENGFVVASENPTDLGQFFGAVEGNAELMRTLIEEEPDPASREQTNRGIFKRLEMTDYQSMCDVYSAVGQGASSTYASQILRNLWSVFLWILNEYILFFLHLNFAVSWSETTDSETRNAETSAAAAAASPNDVLRGGNYYNEYSQYYDDLAPYHDEVRGLVSGCSHFVNDPTLTAETRKRKTKDCLKEIRYKYTPRLLRQEPCVKSYTHYIADTSLLPRAGRVMRCLDAEPCENSYSVNQVPRTNLMLVVVDAVCSCFSEPAMILDPIEIKLTDIEICNKLQKDVFRKRPQHCHAYHEKENYTDCGRCRVLRPSAIALLLSLPLALIGVSH